MKTKALGLLPATALLLLLSGHDAQAQGQRGGGGRGRPPREGGGAGQPSAQGLQTAGGLQTSQLQPSVPFAVRLSDEEWRKQFPIKKAAGQ